MFSKSKNSFQPDPSENASTKLKHNTIVVILQMAVTLLIAIGIIGSSYNSILENEHQNCQQIILTYRAHIDNYTNQFKSFLIPIKDKLKNHPSFDDMQEWIKPYDSMFANAMGENVFDGIAFTYKGGYIHSWSYGNYDDYDPNTRPWYQQAKKANGAITVVAPYVSYLGPDTFGNRAINLTIAQKYDEDIYFDLDLKITEIQNSILNRNFTFDNTKLLMFDPDGYVLVSSKIAELAHNVFQDDDIASDKKEFIEELVKDEANTGFAWVNGTLYLGYLGYDSFRNGVLIGIPFMTVFFKTFLPLILLTLFLLGLEYYVYSKNKNSIGSSCISMGK